RSAMWLGQFLLAYRPTYCCYAPTNRRSRQASYRAVCSKLATLLDNVHRANRNAEGRAELTKRLDVKRPHIPAPGPLSKYHSRIFWIDGPRTRAGAKAPQRNKRADTTSAALQHGKSFYSVTLQSGFPAPGSRSYNANQGRA